MPNSNHQASIYPFGPINTQQNQPQLEQEDDEDVANGEDSIDDSPHIHYQNEGVVSVMNGGVENIAAVSNSLYVPSSEFPPIAAGNGGADQLTLSFQGEVYVFDAVSPDKVQAVLLLLGGYEIPSGVPAMGSVPVSQKDMGEFSSRSMQPQRAASLSRFREKRKERCFDKKIRYNVRKEVALRMQRKKGQFTSSKANSDEVGSTSDWNGNGSAQDESTQEIACTHCGISSKSTPMMRRGPAGPRTLCNACGLKWANKGILRDVPRNTTMVIRDPSAKTTEQLTQNDGEANNPDAALARALETVSPYGDTSAATELKQM